MKIWAYIIALGIITTFLAWGASLLKQAGYDKSQAECSAQREKDAIATSSQIEALRQSQIEHEQASIRISKAFHQSVMQEVGKNAQLRHKLSEKPAATCADNRIVFTAAAVGMLNDCAQSSELPPSDLPSFDADGTVTDTDIAQYTCYAIGEYNKAAIMINAELGIY